MRTYKANMIPGGTTPVINVSQYDNDYAVTVTLIEGAEIYTPPVGATIRVEGTKPDGNGFEYPCTYQGNVVTMPIYTQMTAVAGRFPIELVVYQNGLRVGSCNIVFAVEKAPLGEDTDISKTVIPDIIAVAQAQADAAAASATQAASSAASAETAKDAAMDAAQAAAQSAASLTVDTELSSTSTNPVQNKVIYATVTELKNDLDENVSDLKSALNVLGEWEVGKNLWNPDDLLIGYYANSRFYSDSRMRSTGAIAVSEGDIVTVSYLDNNNQSAVANIYGLAVLSSDGSIVSTPSVSGNTYTVPSGVSYVGVSVRTETYPVNDIQVEITADGQYTSFEPYTATVTLSSNVVSPEVEDARGIYESLDERLDAIDDEIEELQPEADKITYFNLFDFSKWVDGFLKNDGTTTSTSPATSSSTYATSEFMEAKKGDVFVASHVEEGNTISNVAVIGYFAEYDSNKTLLRYVSSNQEGAPVVSDDAAYVRITIRIGTYGTTIKVEKNIYKLFTSYMPYVGYKNLDIPKYKFIPKYIYCAVGRTIEIYNSQILLDNNDYNVQWICDVGSAMNRKFTVTGTSAMLNSRTDSQLSLGQYRLFINIYNKANQLVWQGCSILWIKAALASAKSVIPIGDSLTNWKKWLPECIHLSGNTLTFVGTRYSGADQDSAGNDYASGTIHHEGRSGWSAASYLANTEYTFDDRYDGVSSVLGSANPFWDGNAFSLNHYLTTQGKSVPDAVQIWLGTNDITEGVAPSVANIVSMVNSIRTEYPSLKIIICNTIYRSNQDGYASVGSDRYTGASSAFAYAYNEDIKVMQLAEQLTLALLDMQNVFVSPLYCSHDTEYNFGWAEYHPNPRAEQIVHIPAESVHPSTQGYWQLADILFSAYSAIL